MMQANTYTNLLRAGLYATLALLLFSCKRLGIVLPTVTNEPLTLTTNDSATIVLHEADKNDAAVTFHWTTGTNEGTGAAISYVLEVGRQGENFADPLVLDLGKQVYDYSFTHGSLNDSLRQHWQAKSAATVTLEARIIATVAGDMEQPQISNPVTIHVTPYEPVSTTLYILGDATASGWDNNNAAALTPDPELPGTFTYQGTLSPGHFKFITTRGSFLPSYNKGAAEGVIVYRTSENEPDKQFTVTETSVYKITVNLLTLTIKLEQVALPPYAKLWIIGDAVPKGWDISTPDSLVKNPANPFRFKYNEVLKSGEFKIATAATGNFNVPFYMPLTNHPDLSETGVQLVNSGGDDLKWYITDPGAYKISLDLLNMNIHIIPFQPYSKLWIVGDATPTGWNIDAPTPMIASPDDPNVFTYTGHLNAGEFKIPVSTGDFGTDYFRPYANHPDIGDTRMHFVQHGTAPDDTNDYKWFITTEGSYKITINQLYETISIQKL